MANFQKAPDSVLTHIPARLSEDWKTVLRRPGTYSLFDEHEWRLVVPNNETNGEKGEQARLIGMWGGQDGGQRLDVQEDGAGAGLTIELVSETPIAPHLWLWCITARRAQCLIRPVETGIIGVTSVADRGRPGGTPFAGRLPVVITPEGAFGTNLPNWAGGTRDQTRDAIMSECERQGVQLDTQVAYLLATCEHECGFRPIREGQFGGRTAQSSESFRRTLWYYPYYGRGYVQLTHKRNYAAYGTRLGIELVGDPDLALDPAVALFVLVHGVTNGSFGTAMTHFVNDHRTDFVNARRSVNGLDRAEHIAGLANRWLTWIRTNQPDRFTHGFQAAAHAPGHRAPAGAHAH
jgi:predicted chitinase